VFAGVGCLASPRIAAPPTADRRPPTADRAWSRTSSVLDVTALRKDCERGDLGRSAVNGRRLTGARASNAKVSITVSEH
jgi:hypothetical protein